MESESSLGEVSKIDTLLRQYTFRQNEKYEPCPADLKTADQIKNGIAYGYVSLYGIMRDENGTYTVALIDENYDGIVYQVSGFSENDVLDICNTGYKEACYAEMEERGEGEDK